MFNINDKDKEEETARHRKHLKEQFLIERTFSI